MSSTADCKKFLVDFLSKNRQIVLAYFPDESGSPSALIEALNVNNWKREYKRKAGSGNDYNPEFDEYNIYLDGAIINRYGDAIGCPTLPVREFAWERRFNCDPFEGGLAFIVLENKQGELFLADYVGD